MDGRRPLISATGATAKNVFEEGKQCTARSRPPVMRFLCPSPRSFPRLRPSTYGDDGRRSFLWLEITAAAQNDDGTKSAATSEMQKLTLLGQYSTDSPQTWNKDALIVGAPLTLVALSGFHIPAVDEIADLGAFFAAKTDGAVPHFTPLSMIGLPRNL